MLVTTTLVSWIQSTKTGQKTVTGADGTERTETYTYTVRERVTETITVQAPDPPTPAQFNEALEALKKLQPEATVEESAQALIVAIEEGRFTRTGGVALDTFQPAAAASAPNGLGVAVLTSEADLNTETPAAGPALPTPEPYNPTVTIAGETAALATHALFANRAIDALVEMGLFEASARLSPAFLDAARAMKLSPQAAESLYLRARAFGAYPAQTQFDLRSIEPYNAEFLAAIGAAGIDPFSATHMPIQELALRVSSAGGDLWSLESPYTAALLERADALGVPADVLAAQIDAAKRAPTWITRDPATVYTPSYVAVANDYDTAPEALAALAQFVAPPAFYADAPPELQQLYRLVASPMASEVAFGPARAGQVVDFNGDGAVDGGDYSWDQLTDLHGHRDLPDAALRMHIVQSIATASLLIADPKDRYNYQQTMAQAVLAHGDQLFYDPALTPQQIQLNLSFLLERPDLDLIALDRFRGDLAAYSAYELIGATAELSPDALLPEAVLPITDELRAQMGVAPGQEINTADVAAWLSTLEDPSAAVAAILEQHRATIALTGDPALLDAAIAADSANDPALRLLLEGVFALSGNPIEEAGLDLVAPVGTAGIDRLLAMLDGAAGDPEALARILLTGEVQTKVYCDLMEPFAALVMDQHADIQHTMDQIDGVARMVVAVAAPYAGIAIAGMVAPAVISGLGLVNPTAIRAATWMMRLAGAATTTGAADGFLDATAQLRANGQVDWSQVALAVQGGLVRGAAVPFAQWAGGAIAPILARLPGLTPRAAEFLGTIFTGTIQGGGQTAGSLIAGGADFNALTPEEKQSVMATLVISTASGVIPASRAFDELGLGALSPILSRYAGEVTEEVAQEIFETWASAIDDADLMSKVRSGEITVDEAFVRAAEAAGSSIAETDYGMVIGTTLLITTLTGGNGDLDRVRINLDNLGADRPGGPGSGAQLERAIGALIEKLYGPLPIELSHGRNIVRSAYAQATEIARFLLASEGKNMSVPGTVSGLGTTEALLSVTQQLAANAIAERYGIPAADLRALDPPAFLQLVSSDFWAMRTYRQISTLPVADQLALAAEWVSPELRAKLENGLAGLDPTWIDALRIVSTSRADLARLGPSDPQMASDFASYRIEHSAEALGIDANLNGLNLSGQLTAMVFQDLQGRARLVDMKADYVLSRAQGGPAVPEMDRLLAQTSATYLPDGSAPFVLNVERDGELVQLTLDLPAQDLAAFYAGDAAAAERVFSSLEIQVAASLADPDRVFAIDAQAVRAAYGLGGRGIPGLEAADLQISLRNGDTDSATDPGSLTNLTGDPAQATNVVTLYFGEDGVERLAWRFPHANDAMPMNRLIESTLYGADGRALLEAAAANSVAAGPELAELAFGGDPASAVWNEATAAVPERAGEYSLDALLGDRRDTWLASIREVINPALKARTIAAGGTHLDVSEDQLLLMAMTAVTSDPNGTSAIGEWLVTAGGSGAINPTALPVPATVLAAYQTALESGTFVPSAERGRLLMDALALFNADRVLGADGATMAVRMAHAAGKNEAELTALAAALDPERAAVLNTGNFILGSRIATIDPQTGFYTALSSRHDTAWGISGAGGDADKTFSVRTTDPTLDPSTLGPDVAKVYEMILADLLAASTARRNGPR